MSLTIEQLNLIINDIRGIAERIQEIYFTGNYREIVELTDDLDYFSREIYNSVEGEVQSDVEIEGEREGF